MKITYWEKMAVFAIAIIPAYVTCVIPSGSTLRIVFTRDMVDSGFTSQDNPE